MFSLIKGILGRIPYVKRILAELDLTRKTVGFPPGHYYSPLPSLEEIKRRERELFGEIPRELPGIALNEEDQIALLDAFQQYYDELPFAARPTENLRYFFENPFYGYSDAVLLHCMMRHLRPQKILEVGSGYSSAIILDTNELYFRGSIACTFIDPYPERLLSVLKKADRSRTTILATRVQDVEAGLFQQLAANDILFIDSTHVSKIGSDVHYLLFEVLPALQSGVHIHFHDIFYPFEYPKEWIYKGWAWNEAYLLRAFLQYNNTFRIVLFNTFLEHFHGERFLAKMPLCMKDTGGSIWLKKM